MSDVTGEVKRVHKNNKGAYGILIDDGGGENWYGHGFKEPSFSQGDTISFTATKNGRFTNIDASSVSVQSGGGSSSSSSSSSGSSGGGGGSKSENWEARQKYWEQKEERDLVREERIAWAGARTHAISVVDIGLREDALPLPQKKADKMDAIVAAINEYTEQFYQQTSERGTEDDSGSFADLEDNSWDEE